MTLHLSAVLAKAGRKSRGLPLLERRECPRRGWRMNASVVDGNSCDALASGGPDEVFAATVRMSGSVPIILPFLRENFLTGRMPIAI